MKPTVGSLFAGIGGIDLGLERAGFQTKWQVEIDDYARKVLQRHFPDAERFRDVKQFPPKPDSAWLLHRWKERFSVDILAAGFPCQDISYAGKGAGLKGERSGLFYEVIRIVRILGPEFVLLENVSALLTRGLYQVLGTLASIGYDAEWHCIPAAYVGAPHIRDRVFIFAYSKRERQPRPWKRIEPINTAENPYREASGIINAFRKGACPMCVEGMMGFPPGWTSVGDMPAKEQLTGLGNAITPQVAEYIGRQIIKSIQPLTTGEVV